MCGIAGMVAPGMPAPLVCQTLQRMTDTIVHRGPDDQGIFAAEGVGLGSRRLSIIDLAGGHQPIANEDGSVQVVLNGELYNYLELRKDLESRGHVFRTRSDTEVIVHLYEERGTDFVIPLRGMFGIAVWDRRRGRLVLARDRLGKKPLFYAHRGGKLCFGSEIKTILAADPRFKENDPDAIVPYFRHGFVPEPGTMFRHIRKLPAAHCLVFENDDFSLSEYWRVEFDPAGTNRTYRQNVEELDSLLEDAVRVRLMSDVPLGVLLSGGLDSSAIVAYAHRAGLKPIKTFTIGFDQPEWDESTDAKVIADAFQTDHHVLRLSETEMRKDLPATVAALVRYCDEPFGDSSFLPAYYVSKLARQHVTVALGGDGGDELFAGYSTYRGMKFADGYRRLPEWLGGRVLPGAAEGLARCLPVPYRYKALRAARVLRHSSLPFEDALANKTSLSTNGILSRLFTRAASERYLGSECACYPAPILDVMRSDWPTVTKIDYIGLRFHLLEDMLVKVDRMSMAHALEVRSPLLDQYLVEFAAKLPPSMKLRGWQTKAILRDAVRPYLPPQTLVKRKHGFSVPLRDWFRTSLDEMLGDYLGTKSGPLPEGVFEHSTIQDMLRQHRAGECDHSGRIWELLTYAVWYEQYGC